MSPIVNHTNEFHLTWFDGGGTTGWADFIVDFRAFSRPEAKVLPYVKYWACGEYPGPENKMLTAATTHVRNKLGVSYGADMPGISYMQYEVGGEDFDLVQTLGDKENILSPVRFNAVMAWECSKVGLTYRYQARQLRTGTTPERLDAFMAPLWDRTPLVRKKFRKTGPGKDAFAAMQHAIYRLRTIKKASLSKPWKLMEGSRFNAYWDCACSKPNTKRLPGAKGSRTCDLVHPK